MIQRLKALTVDRGDYAYFPERSLGAQRQVWIPAQQMPIGFMALEGGNGRMIQGLAQYYRATGYEPALQLAGKLANYFCFQAQYYEPDGAWLIGPDERQWWTKRWQIGARGAGRAWARARAGTVKRTRVRNRGRRPGNDRIRAHRIRVGQGQQFAAR